MADKQTTQSVGVGFSDLLTILFIGLKIFEVISWSWWLVLSPLWVPALFAFLAVIVVLFVEK